MDKRELDALMASVAKGSNAAFARLYDEVKKGVFAFAYSYLHNPADAEDIMQEVFLSVKRKAYLYKTGTDVRAWIFQITKNLCLDELRRRNRHPESLDDVKEQPSAFPEFPALDLMTKILDDAEREIVLLHAVWGYKHREIAEMKGMPLGTVTWKYNAAIEKLKKDWEENA